MQSGLENSDNRVARLPSVAEETGLSYRLVPADLDGPFEPPQWFWAGRIPLGELTIVAARGEVGKTTFVLDMAAQFSRGELPGDLAGKKGRTVFFSDEASFERVITPRYAAAGGAPDSLLTLEVLETDIVTGGCVTRPLTLETGDVRMLAEAVEHEEVDLLVFDPIEMILGGIDAHRNNEVRAALRLIMSAGCTVIGIQHLTKSSSVTHAGDRVMGSAAFRNFARSVLVADYDKTDQELIVVAHDKSNYGPRQPSLSFKIVDSPIDGFGRIHWLDEVSITADDLLVASRRSTSKIEACRAWLGDLLSKGRAIPPKEVLKLAEDEGFGRTTVYGARKDTGVTNDSQGRWKL